MRRFIVAALLTSVPVSNVSGQADEFRPPGGANAAPSAALVLGGSAGAATGLLLGTLLGVGLQACDYPDSEGDSCGFSGFTTGAFVGSTVGSILGVQVAGKLFYDRPPIPGSVMGALVGFAGGLVVAWGLYEWGDIDDFPLFLGFSLSQGAITGGIAALRQGSKRR